MELVLTEIVDDSFSIEKEICWLKCRTSSGGMVAFWGELDGANRNIVSLRAQELPVVVELSDLEACFPTETEWERSRYKISLSIPPNVVVTVNAEH